MVGSDVLALVTSRMRWPGLAMQVWMSGLCAIVHVAHMGHAHELIAFAAAQAVFLGAGAIEAGFIESGRSSRAMIPARTASIAALLAYAVVSLRPS